MERKLFKKYKKILAIDEVGRGALAGPLYVGGLLSDFQFSQDLNKLNIKESKQLKENRRIKIYKKIVLLKPNFKIVKFTNKEIDKFGINWCFQKSIEILFNYFEPDLVLVDGKPVKINLPAQKIRFIVKGDKKIKLIAAISIIAKVLRDKYMIHLNRYYPFYGFKYNKGYGTKDHIKAIKKFGISKYHRVSFLKNILSVIL